MRDLSKKQMEELRRMMMMEQGGLLSGESLFEEPAPEQWMEDLYEKKVEAEPQSIWAAGTTPIEVGSQEYIDNITGAMTAGLDGDTTKTYWNTLGTPTKIGQARALDRDSQYWDIKRPLLFGLTAWEGMADLANMEGGRYNERDNPFVWTDEMQAEADRTAAEQARMWQYDPETDRTYQYGNKNGFSVAGDYLGDMERRAAESGVDPNDYSRYYKGHDQLTPEAQAAIREAGGGMGLVDVFSQDVSPLLDAFKRDDWNPFYEGRRQDMFDRLRSIGKMSDKKNAYEKRWQNNALDYLYDNFTEGTDSQTRGGVRRAWEKYMADTNTTVDDYFGRRMTEKMFKDIGLDKFGEFNKDYAGAFGLGDNPLAGMMSGASTDGTYSGDFVEARRKSLMNGPAVGEFQAEKNKQESRKSVMSLFDEMRNFDG